jgi:hypothetical protein
MFGAGSRGNSGIFRRWFGQHQTRGAVVPFEAPALRMARICDDERDGLIAVLRDFANNGTAYIVPWTSLPRMMTMSDHDTALHKAVGETKATTPEQVRAVVTGLALSGALGPEAQAREGKRVRADQTRLVDAELILLLHLMVSCGADLSTLVSDPARWRDTGGKSAVAAVAAAIGVKRQDIHRRIAAFTKLLLPVGLVTSGGPIQAGWLRVLHDEIEAFGQSVASHPCSALPETNVHLAAIADAAQRTARLSGAVISLLDYAVLDIGGTIRRWDSELPVLRQTIDRLSVLLDEWPTLMKSAHDALRGSPDEVATQLKVLHALLPQLPEIDQPEAEIAGNRAGSQTASDILRARLSQIWTMLGACRSGAS